MTYTCTMPRAVTKTARFAARLTQQCKELMEAIADRYGISEAAVVEQAVREYAEKRNITTDPTDQGGGEGKGAG